MQVLEKLFGSGARVKLMRFFILSPEKVFTPKEAAKVLRISSRPASKEVRFLRSLGFLKKRPKGLVLSQTFPYLLALRNLLINASPISREKMLNFFKNKGKIKLLVLGGVFSNDFALDSGLDGSDRLDLLVVGEPKRAAVERFIKKIEA